MVVVVGVGTFGFSGQVDSRTNEKKLKQSRVRPFLPPSPDKTFEQNRVKICEQKLNWSRQQQQLKRSWLFNISDKWSNTNQPTNASLIKVNLVRKSCWASSQVFQKTSVLPFSSSFVTLSHPGIKESVTNFSIQKFSWTNKDQPENQLSHFIHENWGERSSDNRIPSRQKKTRFSICKKRGWTLNS